MKTTFKLCICLIILIATALVCPHVHNNECGYDNKSNSECIHIHDEQCYEEVEKQPIQSRACEGPDCPRI